MVRRKCSMLRAEIDGCAFVPEVSGFEVGSRARRACIRAGARRESTTSAMNRYPRLGNVSMNRGLCDVIAQELPQPVHRLLYGAVEVDVGLPAPRCARAVVPS